MNTIKSLASITAVDKGSCDGIDLDADGTISIAELVRAVNEALEPTPACNV